MYFNFTKGIDFTAIGDEAGKNMVAGTNYNTFVGRKAGFFGATTTTAAIHNTGVGVNVLLANTTGDRNTVLGSGALVANTTGLRNQAFGAFSMQANTTGSENTAFGLGSLFANLTGNQNCAIGVQALIYALASENTALGYRAGAYRGVGTDYNTTGSKGVFLGYKSRAKLDGGVNEIVVGHETLGNGSNTVTIGNDDITDTYLKGAVHVAGTIQPTGYKSSDGSVGVTSDVTYLKANGVDTGVLTIKNGLITNVT